MATSTPKALKGTPDTRLSTLPPARRGQVLGLGPRLPGPQLPPCTGLLCEASLACLSRPCPPFPGSHVHLSPDGCQGPWELVAVCPFLLWLPISVTVSGRLPDPGRDCQVGTECGRHQGSLDPALEASWLAPPTPGLPGTAPPGPLYSHPPP